MRADDVKRYLKPYSIYQSRKTTINHAFAAALAPHDTFELARIAEALECLGQSIDAPLTCVYCDRPAETWDHLTSIVNGGQLHGYGHQLDNLVPCCKTCNFRKGNKDWRRFLHEQVGESAERSERESQIEEYLTTYASPIDLNAARAQAEDWQRYAELKTEVLRLMREAGEVATRLRMSIGRTP